MDDYFPQQQPDAPYASLDDHNPYIYRTIPEEIKFKGLIDTVRWLEARHRSPFHCAPELNELVEVEAADAYIVYEGRRARVSKLDADWEAAVAIRIEYGLTDYDNIVGLPAYIHCDCPELLPHEIRAKQKEIAEEAEDDRAESFESLNFNVYHTEKRYPGLITEQTKQVLEGYDEYCRQMKQQERRN